MGWIGMVPLLLGCAMADSPNVWLSLNSLYGTAADQRHVRDLGAAWEQPLGKGFSLVNRFHYLKVRQDPLAERKRSDNVYANSFPSRYRLLGFQAALRRHPWEWMPGFFCEALAGYKRIDGGYAEADGEESYFRWVSGEESFLNQGFEIAAGFGYLWEWKRMRLSLGFKFGPEWLFRSSVYGDGSRIAGMDVLEFLRFNDLEAGIAF